MKRPSNLQLYGVLLAVLVLACLLGVLTGPVRFSLTDLWSLGILQRRAERVAMAVAVGAGLSIAGVVFQSLLRNPMADPYVLGVSSGAAFGAAMALILGLAALGPWTVPGMAFAGALATIVLVHALARTPSGAVPTETLLLAGIVVNSVLSSGLMFLISVSPSQVVHGVVWWLLGSLEVGGNLRMLVMVFAVVGGGLVASIVWSRDMNVLSLGDEPAAHLGVDVRRSRRFMFTVASLVTAATVAACGMIGFVGLIVPHAVRLAIGPDHRRLVPASALLGAAFLVLADCAARSLRAPEEMPIGVVTSLLGGPVFLFMLRKRWTNAWT
jgi:iron complex transport system permease protein